MKVDITHLKKLIGKVFKAEIFRVFSSTAVSTFIKMLTGFVSTKVVSVIAGPAGVALVGQLQNFSAIVLNLSNGGTTNGIVKYVAEYKDDKETLRRYISSSYSLSLFFSALCAVAMICFNRQLSLAVFSDDSYYYIFIIFGISIILYSLNTLFISIINGFMMFKKYVIVNIVGSIIGMSFTVGLVMLLGVSGALVALVTYQSVVLIVTYLMTRKEKWLCKENLRMTFDRPIVRQLLKFSLMAIVSAVILPLVQIILRRYIIDRISIDIAGYWEGMNRLSAAYIVFISTSYAVYYLPKLSGCKDDSSMKHEIKKVFTFVIPIVLVMFFIIYLLRYPIINILYTREFEPMAELFIPQLLGDFIKIVSWSLSYILLAKSMTKTFVTIEIITPIIYLFFAYFLVGHFNVLGIIYAHIISSVVYLLFLLFKFRHLLKS